MIPKVIFVNSYIYNNVWEKIWVEKHPDAYYPDEEEINGFIETMEPHWRSHEKKILAEISKVLKLEYKEPITKCYITGRSRVFSDPMTVSMWARDEMDFVSTIAHEMIHQIFIQNQSMFKNMHNFMDGKYENEATVTKSHITLHAVLQHIYLKLFDARWLERDYEICAKSPEYTRAWKIVEIEGYENVIKEFVKRLK